MRMVVEIFGVGTQEVLAIDEEKSICNFNGKLIKVDVPKILQEILNVLAGANEVMVDEFIIDGTTYIFDIENNGKTRRYYFKNAFPKGFESIVNIIGGLKRC